MSADSAAKTRILRSLSIGDQFGVVELSDQLPILNTCSSGRILTIAVVSSTWLTSVTFDWLRMTPI